MILNAEHPILLTFQSLYGIIQNIDMGDRQRCFLKAIGIHGVGMVLRCDLNLSGPEILDRMVSASVSKFQLVSFRTISQRNDLVTQTNSEHGIFTAKLPHHLDHTRNVLRISGAVRQEHTVRGYGFDFFSGGIPGKYGNITAPAVQSAYNILLHSAVDGCHMVFFVLSRRKIWLLNANPGHLIGRQGQRLQVGKGSKI